MPLDTEAESVSRTFDTLNHTIRRGRVYHYAFSGVLDCLVMRAVDRELCFARNSRQERVWHDVDTMARLRARVGLLVFDRVLNLIGNMLDQRRLFGRR